MTKEQFITLLRKPATINLTLVKGLEEITEQFPYFQNAHLLLAKQYHGHENIRFESYLRKASAYSSDRKILYELIKLETDEVIHLKSNVDTTALSSVEIKEELIPGIVSAEGDSQFKNPPQLHIVTEEEVLLNEQLTESADESIAAKSDHELPNHQEEKTSVTINPKDIIEQRLRELAKEKTEPFTSTDTGKEKAPVQSETEETAIKVNREAKTVNLEELFESSTDEIKTASVPQPKPASPDKEQSEPHSFLDWLKMKSVPVIPDTHISEFNLPPVPEKINEEQVVRKIHKVEDQIIEKFIKTEPRIVASKSEFYSPGNMARLSAQEHQDLISETLARIYAQQGNIRKAIETYRKLALKSPEKSSYFAALIKELEENEKKSG